MNLVGITTNDVFLVVKILVLIFLFLYILFSIVVVKQTRLMAETLHVDLDGIIRLVSYLHLFFAVAVFTLALFVL